MNLNVDSMVSGIGSAFATLGTYGQQSMNTISSYANDPNLTQNVSRSYRSGLATSASLWSSFSNTVSQAAASIAEPDSNSDGLADFQRRMHEERQNRAATNTGSSSSRYSGFGSDDVMSGKVNSSSIGASKVSQSSQEAENDLMSFNQWGDEDSFATAPSRAPAPAPASTTTTYAPNPTPPPPPINNNIGSTTTTVNNKMGISASKMKIEGTGDDFFSNFGA